ncbi:MAG: alpha/beta hydrolase [Nitrospirae bacterium]|nr:alpha/beta hydrolase [Nitrospirota bacterium]
MNIKYFRWIKIIIIVFVLSSCATAPQKIFHPQALPKHQKWVMVDNIPVVYTEQGDGDAVLILAAYPLGVEAWGELAGFLSKSFRVIVAEPPYLSEPDAFGEDKSSEHLLLVYRSFVRKLDLKEVHVVGAGEGGGLAVAFGHHFPEHIKTAISINGFEGLTWSAKTKEMLDDIYSSEQEKITNLLAAGSLRYKQDSAFRDRITGTLELLPDKEKVKALQNRKADLIQDINSLYIPAMIEYIDFPILMIRSDHDAILPENYAEYAHNRIRGVKYQSLQNSGHFAFLDKPQETAEIIRAFIQK